MSFDVDVALGFRTGYCTLQRQLVAAAATAAAPL
jgi:hypothetical protein